MSNQQAYPLAWPEGWPRRASRQNAPFLRASGQGSREHSMEEATQFLGAELDRLQATKQVLSTNVKLRLDGRPYSGVAQPADPGAAVYFELKGKPVSLACDKWRRVEDNVWAIGKHVEAIRGQNRWGVGSVEQAFRGYMALPGIGESTASTWWQVLGVPINSTEEVVREAYRILVKRHHPDKGGDAEMFRRVMKAMEVFEQSIRKAA